MDENQLPLCPLLKSGTVSIEPIFLLLPLSAT